MNAEGDHMIENRRIVQIAFVVDDLEAACLHWASTFGAGPFFLHDPVPVGKVTQPDGAAAVFEAACGFGQWGPVMVELIKFHRVEPESIAAAVCRPGLSHIAYFESDSDGETNRLQAEGAPALFRHEIGDYYSSWHDARDTIGCLIEHYPFDAVSALYGAVSQAAKDWDGSDPIRGPLL
jgi:hypothetical protein